MLPTALTGRWDQLTKNEEAWIEFIRVISGGRNPRITPDRVRALRELLDAGGGVGRREVSRFPNLCH